MTYRLVEVEEDLQYIAVASRRNKMEHALVRLILTTMADQEEISNLTKRDLIKAKTDSGIIYGVYLKKGGRSRKVPVDRKTYELLESISENLSGKEKIFNYSVSDIDDIIGKNSPSSKSYSLQSVRKALKSILEDNLLGITTDEFMKMDFEELAEFMEEFHPMFSGMWDLESDEVATDYFTMLSERHGMSIDEMSELSGESKERIKNLMDKGWLRSCLDSYLE